jgi:hypothetical protein
MGAMSDRLEELRRQQAVRDIVPVRADVIGGTRQFTLEAVDVGWPIWSAERRYAGDEYDQQPVGGVVVEVTHQRHDDAVTGEIIEVTSYRAVDLYRRRHPWQLLRAGEVDLEQLSGLSITGATAVIRWLCRSVADNKSRTLRPSDVEAVKDAARLTRSMHQVRE